MERGAPVNPLSFAPLEGKRVLVTGATGFLGSHVARKLVGLKARVTALVRNGSGTERIADCRERMDLIEADLRRGEEIARAVSQARPEIVFHLAVYGVDPAQTDPRTLFETNVAGLLSILEALRDHPCRRFVHAGSCFEYGGAGGRLSEEAPLSALNLYAASKSFAWHLCRSEHRRHGLPAVTLRPFTFYGPHERPDRLIPSVIRSILKGEEIRITAGTQRRDYTYVEDVADACLRAALLDEAVGETFNIGSGRELSVLEAAERIRSVMGSDLPIRAGALETRAEEAWRMACDPSKAERLLGWSARTGFEEGISRMVRWMTGREERLLKGAVPK